jgi:chromatin remodeling complex protein RSC6
MIVQVNSTNIQQFVLNGKENNEDVYIDGIVEEEGIGFRKPVRISKEMCDFLKLNHTDKYTRTYVIGEVIKYIKDNSLEDETKNITPDYKLAGLLDSVYGKINYIRLQQKLHKHFIRD